MNFRSAQDAMKAVWPEAMLFQRSSVRGRRRIAVGLGSALRGAQPLWRVPSAPSFLLPSPQLEREGLHTISVTHTRSLPLKRCPGDPAVILTVCLDKAWLVFAHKTFITASLRRLTNQSFNIIEKTNLDTFFSWKINWVILYFMRECHSCDLNPFFFLYFWGCKQDLKKETVTDLWHCRTTFFLKSRRW